MKRIVVGITGASGAVYGVRLLERLHAAEGVESHLIVSRPAAKTLHYETGRTLDDLKSLAAHWHPLEEIGASIASGSYPTAGMIIAPCSIHTLSAIAAGIASNLIVRAADVTLKERRRLILMVRESPLHLGHLRAMVSVTEMGAIVAPPMPAFYHRPASVEEIVDHSVQRVLDLIGVAVDDARRWQGG